MKEGCVTLRTPLDATMLQAEITALKSQVAQLTHQLDWFKRQLFGRKSERRLIEPNPDQPQLDGFNVARPEAAQVEKETITYQRRKGKRRDADCVTEQGVIVKSGVQAVESSGDLIDPCHGLCDSIPSSNLTPVITLAR